MTRSDDISVTEREASVLGPLAEHRLLTVPQVAVLLGVGERAALQRVERLADDRLVRLLRIFDALPPAASIQSRGLRAIGARLQSPQVRLNEYRHEVGVGWLWLAARAGGFGELRGLVTDRRMRAQDAAARSGGRPGPWGVGLGLLGSHGQPSHHYPDLMLDLAGGRRVAVELELTTKSLARIGRIMTAYASDAGVDEVLYVAGDRTIAARLRDAAGRAQISDQVHVRLLGPGGVPGAEIGHGRVGGRGRAARVERGGAQR